MTTTPYRIHSESNIEMAGLTGSVQIELPVSFNHSQNSFLKDLTDLKTAGIPAGNLITYDGTNLTSMGTTGFVNLNDAQTLANKTLSPVALKTTTQSCEQNNANVFELRRIHNYTSVVGMTPIVLQSFSLPVGRGCLLSITVIGGASGFAIGHVLYRNLGTVGFNNAVTGQIPPVVVHSSSNEIFNFVAFSVSGTTVNVLSGRPGSGAGYGNATVNVVVDIKCLFCTI